VFTVGRELCAMQWDTLSQPLRNHLFHLYSASSYNYCRYYNYYYDYNDYYRENYCATKLQTCRRLWVQRLVRPRGLRKLVRQPKRHVPKTVLRGRQQRLFDGSGGPFYVGASCAQQEEEISRLRLAASLQEPSGRRPSASRGPRRALSSSHYGIASIVRLLSTVVHYWHSRPAWDVQESRPTLFSQSPCDTLS